MKIKRWTKENLYILLGLTAAVVLLYAIAPGCVYKRLLGIECVGCGMSRACFALIRLHFARAWAYNPISFVMPFWGAYMVCKGEPFESGRLNRMIFGTLCAVTAVLVGIRVFMMIIST